ncbi:hypothetical protein GX48_04440 [Paracoccidioides brasiliensis]|nr:hypothetical protein GX48_04440 [Paracoccidioides brasiliensis]
MSGIGMETVAARLASFYASNQPAQDGGLSDAKITEYVSWPHERPVPEDLAQAGFYFKPTALSPDNTACFLCERALDGWEEDDDPITEHLKHSSECGWAVIMNIVRQSSNPAEIEDPTSARIVEARRATFASLWPHEGKRGWICKTEKLVEAGWYFCAHEESDDFVSCAYCKLSLDGWEPKDDPFEEHYRRSSDCSFFHFASKKPAKATRGKKSRISKSSRLSAQSVATTVSEAPTVDLDDETDQSALSQSTTKAPKAARKPTKSKGRKTKSKKGDAVETSSQADMESNNGDAAELSQPKRTTRGKKRDSDAMNEADELQSEKNYTSSEPSTKRRTTRSESTTANRPASTTIDRTNLVAPDEQPAIMEEKQPRARKPKRVSSTARKPSVVSNASLKPKIPDDSEIDSQLEAGLSADIEVEGKLASEHEQIVENTEEGRRISTSSAASTRPSRPAVIETSDLEEEVHIKIQKGQRKKNGVKKKPASKKISRVRAEQAPVSTATDEVANANYEPPPIDTLQSTSKGTIGSDLVMEDAVVNDREDESHRDPQPNNVPKKVGRPKGSVANSKKSKKKPQGNEPAVTEESVYMPSDLHESPTPTKSRVDPHVDQENRKTTTIPRKVAFEASGNQAASSIGNGAQQGVNSPRMFELPSERIERASNNPTPPTAPVHGSTPSPSPQSSDAENRPPSSRPSTNRPTSSVFKPQITFMPLATSTPNNSPSKIHSRSGQLITSCPWNPVDPEEIFLSDSMNKENANINDLLHPVKGDLTSPEKKMTVEEWIMWNAKNGETKLRSECERLVGIFEREGGKAMMALEGIECAD